MLDRSELEASKSDMLDEELKEEMKAELPSLTSSISASEIGLNSVNILLIINNVKSGYISDLQLFSVNCNFYFFH